MRGMAAACLFLMNAALCAGPSYWLEGEYLLWSIKKNPVPVPLLTSASYADALPGAIGQSGTEVLLGDDSIRMNWMNGFKVGAGAAASSKWDIEGNYFLLPTVSKKRSFSTSGEPGSANFAVPIFDVSGVCGLNGVPGNTIFILPGPLEGEPGFYGDFHFRISSRLQGAELNGLYHFMDRRAFHLSALGGLRWVQLHESLKFYAETGTVPNVSFPAGFFNFSDRFATSNNFVGGQLGIDAKYQKRRWWVEGEAKGALGAQLEQIKISGSSQTSGGNLFFETIGTGGETLKGGIFAEPSNSGRHKKTLFAYAFEGRLGAGCKPVRHLKLNVGYTFLWLSKVLRPGNQIDPKVNSTLTALADASRSTAGVGPGPIPFGSPEPAPLPSGPKKPGVPFHSSWFFAQGIDIGATLEF